MKTGKPSYLLLFFTLFFSCYICNAQLPTREELEQQRLELKQKIKKINTLLIDTKQKEESILSQIRDLKSRIQATENLIAVINREANLLSNKIEDNKEKIQKLEDELEKLKDKYAKLIRKAHKSSSKQNRLMFLFSSKSFLQAYKRLQYMKQIADYRKEQGLKIIKKTKKVKKLNEKLIEQKEAKEQLLAEKRAIREKLQEDKEEQQALVAQVMAKEEKFTNQIYQKQQRIDKIERRIEELIRKAIAAENKKKGSSSSSVFKMTPEAKALAAKFEDNKGKLPWPVESGLVIMDFGRQTDAIVHKIPVQSNGVRIQTEKNTQARAVFGGVVSMVQAIPGAHMVVMVRHGNYLTVYGNLSPVFVEKGEHVSIGQSLGKIATKPSSGKTVLKFLIYKNTQKLNPANWIYKMN